MPASRPLTLALLLLLAPGLAEAAPGAKTAPAETSSPRPEHPPKPANRPARAPSPISSPVPTTSKPTTTARHHAATPPRPASKATSEPAASRASHATTTKDPGTRTPRPRTTAAPADPTAHTPAATTGTPRDTGTRTPRATPATSNSRPRSTTATDPRDTGTRTPRSSTPTSNVRTDPRDTGVRTPRSSTPTATPNTGVRTPRSSTPTSNVRTDPRDTGVRTPRPRATSEQPPHAAPSAKPPTAPVQAPPAIPPTTSSPVPKTSSDVAGSSAADPTPRAQPTAPSANPAARDPTAKTAPPRQPVPEATQTSPGQPVPEATSPRGVPRQPVSEATQPVSEDTSPQPVPEATSTSTPALAPPAPPPALDPPVPEASSPRPAATRPASTADIAGTPVSKASSTHPTVQAITPAATSKPTRPTTTKSTRLRPRAEPLLARHPAATCALDPLEAVGLRQHERTRDSLREFYWSDMARFFETTFDESEPSPRQADDPAFLPAADVIAALPTSARSPLTTLAAARTVDRLSGRSWTKLDKLLSSLAPADVAALLRADAPTLRAHVWTWLATTKTGGCHLGHIDLDFLESAVADRSIAVEHGDDLVYRSLGDYALEARARLATLDPLRFDTFLTRLTAATEVDPLVRATAHGILLRRAHWDTLDPGLRDAVASVRAATAAAAIEMNREKLEPRPVEHAASDPADLVTEQIVGGLLGIYDPHNHGKPQLRGLLATTRDERLTAAVARWRGRGDTLAPLPVPAHPLKFSAAAPVPKDSPAANPPTRQHFSGASPAAAALLEQHHQQPTTQPDPTPTARPIPGVIDREDTVRIPPMRP